MWKILYCSQSAKETGTVYTARKTVKANERAQHFYACTELLNKFGSAHSVCGGLQHFGMKQLEDEPTHNVYNGEIGSQDNMKSFILTEARTFVHKHVSIDIPEIPQYGKVKNKQ